MCWVQYRNSCSTFECKTPPDTLWIAYIITITNATDQYLIPVSNIPQFQLDPSIMKKIYIMQLKIQTNSQSPPQPIEDNMLNPLKVFYLLIVTNYHHSLFYSHYIHNLYTGYPQMLATYTIPHHHSIIRLTFHISIHQFVHNLILSLYT